MKLPIMGFGFGHFLSFRFQREQPERNVPTPQISGQLGLLVHAMAPRPQIHLNACGLGSWGGNQAIGTFFQLGLPASNLGRQPACSPHPAPEKLTLPWMRATCSSPKRPMEPRRFQHVRTQNHGRPGHRDTGLETPLPRPSCYSQQGLRTPASCSPRPTGFKLSPSARQCEKHGLSWAQAVLSLGRGWEFLLWSLAW